MGASVGIDIHIGDHYIALLHLPTPVLVLLAALALYGVFKLARYVLVASGVWSI